VSLAITEEQRRIVKSILTRVVPDADYLAFGSRLGHRHHRYSDLDIAVKAPGEITLEQLSALEEAFAESDLPFRVDIVDLHRAAPEFRQLVEANHVRL
jgi:type I restriction enzyme S subunit